MKKLILSITAIAAIQVGFSQKKDENIGSEVVNIVKPYTPTISDAFKVKQTPVVEEEVIEPKIPIKFQIFSFPVASTFLPSKGKAADVDKEILEKKYKLPVYVNNDANCFALGEFHFGKGRGKSDMIGLSIGTGLGGGAIVNKHLFAGSNCGAGEFGMVDYLDHNYEYYASGQYFSHIYNLKGEEVFERAKAGDKQAQQYYAEMGTHLGNAIKTIMYTYDASFIVLGGSVRHAYPYFEKNMWARINTFAFGHSITNLKIELSELENAGILGAAGLYYDQL